MSESENSAKFEYEYAACLNLKIMLNLNVNMNVIMLLNLNVNLLLSLNLNLLLQDITIRRLEEEIEGYEEATEGKVEEQVATRAKELQEVGALLEWGGDRGCGGEEGREGQVGDI